MALLFLFSIQPRVSKAIWVNRKIINNNVYFRTTWYLHYNLEIFAILVHHTFETNNTSTTSELRQQRESITCSVHGDSASARTCSHGKFKFTDRGHALAYARTHSGVSSRSTRDARSTSDKQLIKLIVTFRFYDLIVTISSGNVLATS